ncbi:MAG: DUF3089 domain-containing protein [Caulobacteraceae bacterium]|nr:DUF3089 domain-containing protein [Caulobacteraceae bacterium]
MARRDRLRFWLAIAGGGVLLVVVAALAIWRDDILEALLDPKVPFAVYRPPPPPAYAKPSSWALLPGPPMAGEPPADVFFVHPTTFDGGRDWNGPIDDAKASGVLTRVMLPNYAAPFAGAGRVFAPRYRQASLYTSLTLFDDAVEARQFAYGDVRAAFHYFLRHLSRGRPFLLVGVEQGGTLSSRLLREEIASDPAVKSRLVAAYLVETVEPLKDHAAASATPMCAVPDQAGCVLAWVSVRRGDIGRASRILDRTVVWNGDGKLVGLTGRRALCVNPILGAATDADAPARLNLGAANATGLEWETRPAFMVRQAGARCDGGVLRVTRPRSASLRPSGAWAERLKVPPYNIFYANLEADAVRRVAAWRTPRAATARFTPLR